VLSRSRYLQYKYELGISLFQPRCVCAESFLGKRISRRFPASSNRPGLRQLRGRGRLAADLPREAQREVVVNLDFAELIPGPRPANRLGPIAVWFAKPVNSSKYPGPGWSAA